MNIRYSSAAHRELTEAVNYYEEQQEKLGSRFLDEVEAAITRISQSPGTWAHSSPRVQRCLLHRFPFAVFYHHAVDEIQILAVADLRRDPQRWERLR